MYIAIHFSNHDDNKTFHTKEEAEEYIEGLCCSTCLSDLKEEYSAEYDDNIYNILDTPCGAEWTIIKDRPYDNLSDIFEAMGCARVDK
jgi:hydrogenase maturation factor HypF (carbamoyltransferase family)